MVFSRSATIFKDSIMVGLIIQVVAGMLSDHTNKGMLTDSYTAILFQIDISRSLEIVNHKVMVLTTQNV
ncbi:uncharacterized protein AC631_03459 [Debaryomyces fabryi]|uniref:Uncharacterized protein n=1 Tax=Debaryomyces fabryi TaxID=58627 RepID=A0A0V1PXH0_9ASCO|nr:uncharacterized protein AC631_03459 [Debaryomyces fabryi]KSA00810.1 hypothetical protein AC631_03459 [Debaryomyces fabryi]CUM55079.1 unnamed protein product [Debaryomyces fabryi]